MVSEFPGKTLACIVLSLYKQTYTYIYVSRGSLYAFYLSCGMHQEPGGNTGI